MKTSKILSTATGLFMLVPLSASAVTITNGSLTGSLGNSVVPLGWSVVSPSPDTNNISQAAGAPANYGVTAVNSSDGGTWVGIARDGNGFVESFSQSVSGFNVGSTYTLSWETANFGYSGYTSANAIEALVGGASAGTGATHLMATAWHDESLQFVATGGTLDIGFRLASVDKSYMQIDGITLGLTAVPLPAAAWLFGSGLLGLVGMARRKKA